MVSQAPARLPPGILAFGGGDPEPDDDGRQQEGRADRQAADDHHHDQPGQPDHEPADEGGDRQAEERPAGLAGGGRQPGDLLSPLPNRVHAHRSTPTSASARSTAAAGGSSTRSSGPPPGAGSTNVRPPEAFLSRRMRVIRSAADRPSGACVGRPKRASIVRVASGASAGRRSRAAASSAAKTRPTATASPWRR